jgi:hypothetical protein
MTRKNLKQIDYIYIVSNLNYSYSLRERNIFKIKAIIWQLNFSQKWRFGLKYSGHENLNAEEENIEIEFTFKMLVTIYQIIWCHNWKDLRSKKEKKKKNEIRVKSLRVISYIRLTSIILPSEKVDCCSVDQLCPSLFKLEHDALRKHLARSERSFIFLNNKTSPFYL